MNLNDIKLYLRVDNDNEDILINDLMLSADDYLAGAIDDFHEKYENADVKWKAKADQAKRLLIANWYENRLPTPRPVNAEITLLITQLQY